MAGGLQGRRGGITGLQLDVLSNPARRAALQYDLLKRGLSLDYAGTEAFSWYDVLVMVRYLQNEFDSAFATELHGPRWSIEAQLLAELVDTTRMANWQRAGKRSAPKPKRIPRPWEKPKSTTIGKGAIPISKFNDWWDNHKPKRRGRRTKKPPTA